MLQMMIDVLHMFYNFQGHVLHMFYNFQNDSKNNLNIKDMATFKTVALRQRADGFWNVSIQVTHNRKSRYLKTISIFHMRRCIVYIHFAIHGQLLPKTNVEHPLMRLALL